MNVLHLTRSSVCCGPAAAEAKQSQRAFMASLLPRTAPGVDSRSCCHTPARHHQLVCEGSQPARSAQRSSHTALAATATAPAPAQAPEQQGEHRQCCLQPRASEQACVRHAPLRACVEHHRHSARLQAAWSQSPCTASSTMRSSWRTSRPACASMTRSWAASTTPTGQQTSCPTAESGSCAHVDARCLTPQPCINV